MNRTMHRPLACVIGLILALEMTAAEAGTVFGTVVRTGTPSMPVQNARVTLFDPGLSVFREVRSDGAGQYTMDNVPAGTWRLGACSPGLAYSEIPITVGAGPVQNNFTLATESHQGQWTIIGNTGTETYDASDIGILLTDGRIMYCHDTLTPTLFNPITGQSAPGADSGLGQGCMNITLLQDGRAIFVGGQPSDDPGSFRNAVRYVKAYDATSNTWQRLADLQAPTGRWYPGMVRLADGSLMAMGGGTCCNAVRTATCERLNLTTLTWSLTASMLNPSEFTPCALLYTGEVLITWYPAQLFNPQSGQWRATGSMVQSPRRWPDHSDHSLVVLSDGRALAIGIDAQGVANPAMGEIYDPATGTWSLTSNPGLIRFQSEVVPLPDGQVFVGAGQTRVTPPPVPADHGVVKWTDLYNPATNTWRRMADMIQFREYHAVTLLVPDGRVLTTGGTVIQFSNPPRDSNVEAFSPPYLFRGVRPQITQLSTTQPRRGQTIAFDVFPAMTLTSAVVMGTGAATHWVDGGVQRRLVLPVQQAGTRVCVTLPADPNVLPLGHYMLFAMVDDIPSVARIIRVNNDSASVAGDFNASGRVDAGDVSPFIAVLLGQDAACERVSQADMNGDGSADGSDIGLFVAALLAP